MRNRSVAQRLIVIVVPVLCMSAGAQDWRNIKTGNEIPSIAYADQPYIVVLDDGTWVCTLTTGLGHEGKKGQHIIATRSTDKGATWSKPVPIEPPDGPEASWVVPLLTDFGRIYGFYTYNGDQVHLGRDDTHGWYAYRYSDDGGRTWSERRRLPYRLTACDTLERDGQIVPMFWGICKPITVDGTAYFSFTKLGGYFLEDSEGWLFTSPNVMTERDVDDVQWTMLPEGEHGIRHPDFGSVQEEHNLAALSNPGELICVYRTTLGHPAVSYTRDGGRSWSTPKPMRYAPDSRIIRNPRACPKIWRCENGKFLFWFHNHGGKDFNDRNPAWISGGIEKDGEVVWSEPEILLYHDDPAVRMSYPDLIEVGDDYYVTETQKEIARVHKLDATLLEGMWDQLEGTAEVVREGLLLEWDESQAAPGTRLDLPSLVDGGWTIDLRVRIPENIDRDVSLVGAKHDGGRGFAVTLVGTEEPTIQLEFGDGDHTASWDVDPGRIHPGAVHNVTFIVDGGPNLITVLVDGVLCDGNLKRQWGFGRFTPAMGDVGVGAPIRVSDAVDSLRVYDRYLTTSEAVSNHRADSARPRRD